MMKSILIAKAVLRFNSRKQFMEKIDGTSSGIEAMRGECLYNEFEWTFITTKECT